MRFLSRTLQRIFILAFGALALWFIATKVFSTLDKQLPLFLALILTYIIPVYVLLPLFIHIGVTVLRRGRIPRMTRAGDGLIADPVNLLFVGTAPELIHAFKNAGWYQTDVLTLRTAWKMGVCFAFNKPYPSAPFSPLFLFGRPQDYGFELPIGNSPRMRHHVRFWAANVDPQTELTDVRYWIKKKPADLTQPLTWVGAASKDIGFGLTELTYRLSHKTDLEVDEERDLIIDTLKESGGIVEEHFVDAEELVAGKYTSDGKLRWARLAPPSNIQLQK